MKILIINGSQRQKNTYNLLKRIEGKLSDFDTEFINIKDYKIDPCIGCENCLRKGTCHIKDEAKIILDKMIEADGIIIGTPIYLRHIPGELKMLFDRGCSWYHRSPLVGKPMMFAITTQVTGTKNALAYLKDLTVQWGAIYSGNISRTVFNTEDPIKQDEFKTFYKYLNNDNLKKYRPSYKQIFEFNTQKVLAEEILPIDLEFWTENGYINKPYFFKSKIGLIKRFSGFLFYKFLRNVQKTTVLQSQYSFY